MCMPGYRVPTIGTFKKNVWDLQNLKVGSQDLQLFFLSGGPVK